MRAKIKINKVRNLKSLQFNSKIKKELTYKVLKYKKE